MHYEKICSIPSDLLFFISIGSQIVLIATNQKHKPLLILYFTILYTLLGSINPVFANNEVISMDTEDRENLVDAVNQHVLFLMEYQEKFLASLSNAKRLRKSPTLSRYKMWLEVWSKNPELDLQPPRDIFVQWYVHRQNMIITSRRYGN